ncbi:HNH endonuclease signature motif containing protein [Kaistella pullorum]|uniref:HNH endonuclease n=1 Tax=Kaistella pullorum TaxID=2763074 RepID=A0ABR8WMN0_9FLAO|nr:HNH endonuclease signature motif containing protein [Kaistella pullorum]MBD8018133.1 HNH endonuclease [Kaistella pullorum]
MIYDFRKGKSALYFSSLLAVDYEYDVQDFILSNSTLEHDHIGYYRVSKKNGFVRLGSFLPEYKDIQFKRTPAFHIHDCQTTDRLGRRMKVTNSARNTYWSLDKQKEVEADLEICWECLKKLRREYKISMGLNTFNNFVLSLEENPRTKQTIVDGNGYTINWKQLSFCYRDFRRFTCEKCGFKAKNEAEQRFLHSHHRNGIKTDNNRSNLQCLCVKCHSNVDDHHRAKFSLEGLSLLLDFEQHINTAT